MTGKGGKGRITCGGHVAEAKQINHPIAQQSFKKIIRYINFLRSGQIPELYSLL
jgi:hypothetical protein